MIWFSVSDTHSAYVILQPGTTKEEMEKEIAKVHVAQRRKSSMNHDIIPRRNLRTFTMTLVSQSSVARPLAGKQLWH